jgi:hypothetical protein
MAAVVHRVVPQQVREARLVVEGRRVAVAVVAVTREVPMATQVARLPVSRVVLQWRTAGWTDLHCTGRAGRQWLGPMHRSSK